MHYYALKGKVSLAFIDCCIACAANDADNWEQYYDRYRELVAKYNWLTGLRKGAGPA
jgi:hypothetical protein